MSEPTLRRQKRSPYYYVEGLDWQGKPFRVSTKQKDRVAAKRVGREIILERSVPGVRPYALSQALVALYEHKVLRQVSDAELEIVKEKSARLLEHFTPQCDCNALTIQKIEGYIKDRRSTVKRFGRNRKPVPGSFVQDSSIEKELGILYQALRKAKRDGKFAGEVEDLYTDVLSAPKRRKRVLTEAQYLAIWNALVGVRRVHRRKWLLLFCHTGARWSELHRIEFSHVDHDARHLWLIGKKGREEHRERWVPLSDEAYALLCELGRERPTGPLLPKPWRKSNLRQTLGLICKKLCIPPVSANDLRRTFATWHAKWGTDERDTQKFMGHSPESKLVRTVYTQLREESGRVAANSFPKVNQDAPDTPDNVVALPVPKRA